MLVVINKQKFWEPSLGTFLRTIRLQCNPDVVAFSTIPLNCIWRIIFYPQSGSNRLSNQRLDLENQIKTKQTLPRANVKNKF